MPSTLSLCVLSFSVFALVSRCYAQFTASMESPPLEPVSSLIPSIHPDIDVNDYANLRPSFQYSMFYSKRKTAGNRQTSKVGIISVSDAQYPAVQLQQSGYISSVRCQGPLINVAFDIPAAQSFAESSWREQNPFVIILFGTECSSQSDAGSADRSFHLVNSISSNPSTNSIIANATEIDIGDALGHSKPVTINFGTYVQNDTSSNIPSQAASAHSPGITSTPTNPDDDEDLSFPCITCAAESIFDSLTAAGEASFASLTNAGYASLYSLESAGSASLASLANLGSQEYASLTSQGLTILNEAQSDAQGIINSASAAALQVQNEAGAALAAAEAAAQQQLASASNAFTSIMSVASASAASFEADATNEAASLIKDAESSAQSLAAAATSKAAALYSSLTAAIPQVTESYSPALGDTQFDSLKGSGKAVDTPWGIQGYNIYSVSKGAGTINVYCVSCGVYGDLAVSGTIAFVIGLQPHLREAYIEVSGSMGADLGIGVAASYTNTFSIDKNLFTYPVPDLGLAIGKIFSIGTTIALDVGGDLTIDVQGKVLAGVGILWPSIDTRLDMLNNSDTHALGFRNITVSPVIELDTYIDVNADVYITPKIQFGIALAVPKLFSKSYQLALVDQPGLSFDTNFAAGFAAGSGASGAGSNIGNGQCPGVDVTLGFENTAYLDVLDLTTVSINSYTKQLYSKCITLTHGSQKSITTVGSAGVFGAHATNQGGGAGNTVTVTQFVTINAAKSASASPKSTFSTHAILPTSIKFTNSKLSTLSIKRSPASTKVTATTR